MEENERFNEKEFLEKVENAAREGAEKAAGKGIGAAIVKSMIKVMIPALVIIGIMTFFLPKRSLGGGFKNLFNKEEDVEEHDLTLENQGFFGYTTADFAEAVLSDRTQLKKLEVLSYKVTDAATLTDAGFAKLSVFSKTQLITYHGTAVYTIDLAELTMDNIHVDESARKVYLTIPHAVQEPINIQASDIEFGDVEKGTLAFGQIKLTPQQQRDVQVKAQETMERKLIEQDILSEADRFGKMAVWELYQPIISSVSPAYKLEVVFEDPIIEEAPSEEPEAETDEGTKEDDTSEG